MRLFKKNNKGSIQEWSVQVEGTSIITTFGQLGGAMQTTTDIIKSGKNVGKKNSTTPEEQAHVKAKQMVEKKLKSGYVVSLKDAEEGKVDEVIEGGVLPMLAHDFAKHGHKIIYPCYVQPKLDGQRLLAIIVDGKATLWTRTRKPVTSVPHIVEALEKQFPGTITLDGELYNHKLKHDFEKLMSAARKEYPTEESSQLEYHIYDVINEHPFHARNSVLKDVIAVQWPLVFVPTYSADSEDEALGFQHDFEVEGYEGAILRNANGFYVGKRSVDLLKLKTFEDAEFEVVGVEEGNGKLMGHAGAFVCLTEEGKHFNVKMAGDTAKLKEYFENFEACKGKMLTVKFQGRTAEQVPRFPVGKAFRDE